MKKPQLINLPIINDKRGNLSFLQYPDQLPFIPQRVFWIYDVPGGISRGGHAYKTQEEIIIALSGSFDIITNDGKTENTITMNRSYYGLYIPSKNWRKIENFSTNSLALIISNQKFSESEYVRDFTEFKNSLDE